MILAKGIQTKSHVLLQNMAFYDLISILIYTLQILLLPPHV